MPKKQPCNCVADPTRSTVASLGFQVKLMSREDDTELKALVERYEQLLCDWEDLSHRGLKALADRSHLNTKSRHALHHP